MVERLLLIRFCQKVGFRLAEIGELLVSPSGSAAERRFRELAERRIGEVEGLIAQAEAV